MSLKNGVVIGLVTKISDKGMVKIKYPWLPDEPETKKWVRIATTMAGDDRGTFFMPEKKDEVLVAFDNGDFNSPYVIGFLWNGKDKPPEKDKNIRRIKTKTGHTVEFNDNKGQEKIEIKSQGGQVIEINDTAQGMITITTKKGTVNINCINANVTAKAAINVSAPTATFSGVIQAPTIIAGSGQFGAVASGAYNTFVPGNFFGL